jgi:hypothetical protein
MMHEENAGQRTPEIGSERLTGQDYGHNTRGTVTFVEALLSKTNFIFMFTFNILSCNKYNNIVNVYSLITIN